MSVFVLAALLSPAGAMPQTRAPIALQIHSASEDKTTKRFSSAVIKEFKQDSRFAIFGQGSGAGVVVTLPNEVGYERSLDWIRISYQARIDTVGGASRTIAGSCWNWNLRVCAQQITNAAAGAQ